MVGAVATAGDGDARIALINVAEVPVRCTEAEQALNGGASIDEVAAIATRDLEPSADLHASAAYRKKVAGVCVKRAITRAQEGSSK
jgi:carbon-monoxide dehydrogenase medium subunit